MERYGIIIPSLPYTDKSTGEVVTLPEPVEQTYWHLDDDLPSFVKMPAYLDDLIPERP